nr:MAG TPA: hypothetical protein [Caudoviricetes sp.]
MRNGRVTSVALPFSERSFWLGSYQYLKRQYQNG